MAVVAVLHHKQHRAGQGDVFRSVSMGRSRYSQTVRLRQYRSRRRVRVGGIVYGQFYRRAQRHIGRRVRVTSSRDDKRMGLRQHWRGSRVCVRCVGGH